MYYSNRRILTCSTHSQLLPATATGYLNSFQFEMKQINLDFFFPFLNLISLSIFFVWKDDGRDLMSVLGNPVHPWRASICLMSEKHSFKLKARGCLREERRTQPKYEVLVWRNGILGIQIFPCFHIHQYWWISLVRFGFHSKLVHVYREQQPAMTTVLLNLAPKSCWWVIPIVCSKRMWALHK